MRSLLLSFSKCGQKCLGMIELLAARKHFGHFWLSLSYRYCYGLGTPSVFEIRNKLIQIVKHDFRISFKHRLISEVHQPSLSFIFLNCSTLKWTNGDENRQHVSISPLVFGGRPHRFLFATHLQRRCLWRLLHGLFRLFLSFFTSPDKTS